GKSGRIVNCVLVLKSYSEYNRQLHSEDVLYPLHSGVKIKSRGLHMHNQAKFA
ncbi:hypothetical protein MKX01_020433, partial [Papaver californicum]